MKYKKIIDQMTLKEKASLMSGKDFWQTKNLDAYNIPSMFLADGPHGMRKQAVAADHLGLNESLNATCFPTAASMANSWNPVLGEELGKRLGKEAVSQHVNVVLGPGTNIKRNPRCGRNFEYFSEDPILAGKLAASYIRGIQSNGISACVKHFAANNQEHRRLVSDSVVDERTLREIYLTAFEIAVKEGETKTIMSSYNLLNGIYANENEHLLKEILRELWGYKGVIVSDWGGNNDRVKAIKTTQELEMPTTGGETNRDIVNAVQNGELDEKVLDEAVDRLLTLIFDTSKVFENEIKPFDIDEHHTFAGKAAEECVVLLKNEDNILPLAEGTKVAVIGDFAKNPRYQGAGSSIVNPTKLDSALDYIALSGLNSVGYEPGFKRYGKQSHGMIKDAIRLAKKADVILLYLGLDEVTELEGMDKPNLELPLNQRILVEELAKLNKPIVATLACGSVIEMDFEKYVHALVHGFLGGQAAAQAVLNVITGKVNPSGKLAESYAFKYEDYSTAFNYPGKELTAEYREGPYVGYRYFDTAGINVKYPFGYGLSYTSFKYSDLVVDDKGVSFKVKNTGNKAGKEISQLYVGLKNSKVYRPTKELKGFSKVELQPGQEQTVKIAFDDMSFRYFNIETNKFEVESGDYDIYIGSSSVNIELSGKLAKEGTTKKFPKQDVACYKNADVQHVSNEDFKALIGREIPQANFIFYKKKRMHIHINTTIEELRYARGWFGRFFAGAIRFLIWFLRFIGKRDVAAVLSMGMLQQPLRGISRMSGGMISWLQLHAMIEMFNGHFFKGLYHFFKAGKQKRKLNKQEKLESGQ